MGSELTPHSVSVRGYYRSDGTYVNSYNRRPPGSVKHDKPYETIRFITLLIMLPSGLFFVSSFYIIYSDKKIKTIAINALDNINKSNESDKNDFKKIITYAVVNEKKLQFFYTNREGISSERVIKPIGLKFYKGTHCLFGYSYKRFENRHFSINRIKKLKLIE